MNQMQAQFAQRFNDMSHEAGAFNNNVWAEDASEDYLVVKQIALIHSEISEALEAFRKNLDDDHLPNRRGIEVELADAVIRIMNIADQLSLDIGGAIVEKHEYNQRRLDHKPEARAAFHGKRF